MDMFISMSNENEVPTNEESYKLLAITCLLISAKSYERDDMIPKTSQLQYFLFPDLGQD